MCGRNGVKEDFDERLHRYIIVSVKTYSGSGDQSMESECGKGIRHRRRPDTAGGQQPASAAPAAWRCAHSCRPSWRPAHPRQRRWRSWRQSAHACSNRVRCCGWRGSRRSRPKAIDRQPAHFQQFRGNLGIERIVLYQQHAPPGLPAARFPVARTDIAPLEKSKTCPTPP